MVSAQVSRVLTRHNSVAGRRDTSRESDMSRLVNVAIFDFPLTRDLVELIHHVDLVGAISSDTSVSPVFGSTAISSSFQASTASLMMVSDSPCVTRSFSMYGVSPAVFPSRNSFDASASHSALNRCRLTSSATSCRSGREQPERASRINGRELGPVPDKQQFRSRDLGLLTQPI